MENSKLLSLISGSPVLHLFYADKKFTPTRAIGIALLLFTLPVLIIIVSLIEGVFSLEGEVTGLSDDYLFWSFYFVLLPLMLLSFKLILNRFAHFLEDIPLFCQLTSERYHELYNNVFVMVDETGRSKFMIAAKYVAVIIALLTNFYSLIRRTGSWNSLEHPIGLWITMIHLGIVLCILADIAAQYMVILWAELKITRQLAREEVIVVRPMAPDNCGGLKSLGDLSLSFTYFLLPLALTAMTCYFTNRMTTGMLVGLPVYIPVFVFVFFAPLSVVHRAMDEAKRNTLHELGKKYQDISERQMRDMQEGKRGDNWNLDKEFIEVLENMYDKASKMPIWPFNTKTLVRFVTVTIGPLSIVLFENLMRSIF